MEHPGLPSLTIDEVVSGPLSALPFLLLPLYFLIVISAGDKETKLGLDAAPSTDMASCIIKGCMRSPSETRGGSGRCAV